VVVSSTGGECVSERKLKRLAEDLARAVRRHDKAWPECAGAGCKEERWAVSCLVDRVILPKLRELSERA
jgi:hypothetical protein